MTKCKTKIDVADVLAILQAVADQMHAVEREGHAIEARIESAKLVGQRKALRQAQAEWRQVDHKLAAIDREYQGVANLLGSMVFSQWPEPIDASHPDQRTLILPGCRVAIIDRRAAWANPLPGEAESYWVELTAAIALT
jgi:hypothetical protein